MLEITRNEVDSFRRVAAPGSLAHFLRTGEP